MKRCGERRRKNARKGLLREETIDERVYKYTHIKYGEVMHKMSHSKILDIYCAYCELLLSIVPFKLLVCFDNDLNCF